LWRRVHDAAELGQSLAELRKQRGMSQQDLAAWLGVDRTTVVRLESGGLGALSRLTDALAVLGANLVVLPRNAEIRVSEAADREAPSSER
jgi:DNA-binding XRE family transcriptional regulator